VLFYEWLDKKKARRYKTEPDDFKVI